MSLTSLARSLSTDGRFSTRDADKVLAQARTANSPASVDEVKALLTDPGLSALISAGARRRLGDFVSAAAPVQGSLGALPDGTKVFLKQGVFVAAPDAALPATAPQFGQTLYRAARMFAEPGQNIATKMSVGDRTAVVDRVLVGLRQCAPGATAAGYAGPTQAAQQRSASATVLREVMGSLQGSDAQGKLLQDKVLKTLVEMVQKETVPGLRDHMAFHLNALKGTLATPEQKALVESAFTKFAPLAPPYGDWFKNGNTTLNVVCHTGGEFFASEVSSWKSDGFKVTQEGDYSKPTILEKDVAGPGGVVTKVRLKMVNGEHGTFDDMKDPEAHVVAYSGHSGWGKNMPRQLKNSPDMSDPPKVLIINQCCGQGITNKVRDRYPDADLLTTRYSSYEHEDHFAFKSFLTGVAGRKSWDDIHTTIAGGGSSNRRNNYITPSDELTRMKTYDRDHDGRSDLLDRLFDFDSFDVPGDTATAFVPSTTSNRDKVLSVERVHNASQIINTSLGFSDYLKHIEVENAFVGGATFTAQPGTAEDARMVRIVEKKVDLKAMGVDVSKAHNGSQGTQTMYELPLNTRFAHASEEVVKAVGFMEVAMKFGDGGSRADKALQGLMLVAHTLNVDEEFGREDEIFTNLLKHYGLPETLTYSDARRFLSADSHVYAGSTKGLDQWKRSLGAAGMATLEAALKPAVG